MKARHYSLALLVPALLLSPALAQFGVEQVIHSVPSAGFFASITAADIDGDGDTDLASAYIGGEGLGWYRNDGAGNFGPAQGIDASLSFARWIRVGDLDGDGDQDLVAAADPGSDVDTVVVYENLGNEVFGPRMVIDSRIDSVTALRVIDLDEDGDLDVVASYFCYDSVLWFENQGSSVFAPAAVLIPNVPFFTGLQFADFDGDGDRDLAASIDANGPELLTSENLGAGIYAAPTFYDLPETNGLTDVGTGDVDRDGDLDLLVARSSGSRGYAWLENQAGDFSVSRTIESGPNSWRIEAVDVDRDGDLDAITVDEAGDRLFIHENVDGAFEPSREIAQLPGQLWEVALADLNGDQYVDLAIPVAGGNARVSWYANESPRFESYCDPAVDNSTGGPGRLFASGSDLLSSNDIVLEASSLPPGAITVFLASQVRGFFPGARGSVGNLCLAQNVGRFLAPGRVSLASASGSLSLAIDSASLPTSGSTVGAAVGETWHFQGWFRDEGTVPVTSNFTSGLSITFQ